MNPYLLQVSPQMIESNSQEFLGKSFLPTFPKLPSPKQKLKRLAKNKSAKSSFFNRLLVVNSHSLEKIPNDDNKEKYKQDRKCRKAHSWMKETENSYENEYSSFDSIHKKDDDMMSTKSKKSTHDSKHTHKISSSFEYKKRLKSINSSGQWLESISCRKSLIPIKDSGGGSRLSLMPVLSESKHLRSRFIKSYSRSRFMSFKL
ncbi:unnamed protein product [Blepharisma stoltei]|uniref:Uncharacterized protein n=1 Tax=Blepharisma stoltei TaxID=1481888 RepID=A0AAU9IGN4_9CILI|nr:unnamed protein product [Blepharisma stoltei]